MTKNLNGLQINLKHKVLLISYNGLKLRMQIQYVQFLLYLYPL